MSNPTLQRAIFSSLEEMRKASIRLPDAPIFVSDWFAVVYDVKSYNFIHSEVSFNVPYRIDDLRFLILTQGSAQAIINLQEQHLSAGNILFVNNGSTVMFKSVSAETKVTAVVISREYLRFIQTDNIPQIWDREQSLVLHPSQEQLGILTRTIPLLHDVVALHDDSHRIADHLLSAIIHTVAYIYNKELQLEKGKQTRSQQLFTAFLRLVNEHSSEHHTLEMYASKLCVTPRYLSSVVSQVSGVSAKEWIDRSIATTAQVALKHSDVPIAQLADDLHFPNAAFFTKFFKRITGLTPSQYRKM